MAVTAAQLRAEFPDLQDISDAALAAAIGRAERAHDPAALGAAYDDVVSLYVCHLVTASRVASSGGASSVTAGPLSVSYAGASTSVSFYDLYKEALARARGGSGPLGIVSGMYGVS